MNTRVIILFKLALIAAFSFYCARPVKVFLENRGVDPLSVTSIKYVEHIIYAAATHRIDPAIIAAVVAVESNFNPKARSYAGAAGLMQINGVTARYLKIKNIYDPKTNILAGARYLSELLEKFNGDTKLMLAAYNAGPGAVRKYNGVPPYKETRRYIEKVMNFFRFYKNHPDLSKFI
ncbi:MAG: lytic transglycosylase domain-containing protein [Deltaproteobacteria bacterium]|nr:lytic transglycosylase domain-containing protein [Deltaproteobacteria bacterium]MBI2341629.1 lytic transglycosylase domain-containing protein [Deltaproteobacteria bacterium]MBI2974272.1 lytic transglycosylase domain-containing protein [Deltaproteobacteria bacterium]